MGYYGYMSDEATFTRVLGGREIQLRRPNLGQILMLQRIAQRNIKSVKDSGKDDHELARVTQDAMVRVLDFIDTLFLSEEDRLFVEDEMIAGKITHEEIFSLLTGEQDKAAEDDAPPPVKKTAAKRSPKAAPVKKVAKTAAPRGRTKR